MSEEETNSLKYGDRIILRCSTESKYYYLLMRGEQCVMEAHLQINNPRSFNMYDYHQQLVFTIFPKLLYEAQKKYFKNMRKQLRGPTQEIQNQLLLQRMEAEKQYNQTLIKSTRGSNVTYGDTIMLYHMMSEAFLTKSDESKSKSILGPAMYFTIQPDPLALDLISGVPVRSFDQFLLVQTGGILKFDTLLPMAHLPDIGKSANFDHDSQYLTFPIIIENQGLFKFSKATYKSMQHDSKESLSLNAMQAIVLPPVEPHLCYGSYVRIKHYKYVVVEEDKKKRSIRVEEQQEGHSRKGYITSSINAIGCYPQVFLQVNEITKESVLERGGSIFQIVPDVDTKYGLPVHMQVGNKPNLVGYTHLLLRHLLTGKYLRVNPKEHTLELSGDLIDKYMGVSQNINKKPEKAMGETVKQARKNNPAIRLYQSHLNNQEQDERMVTLPQQQSEEMYPSGIFQENQLLFMMKLGNNPSFSKEHMPFTYNTSFNMATADGQAALQVESSEDAYQEKLMAKNSNFNYYSDSNPEQMLRKQLQEEWVLLLPSLESFQKKLKFNLTQVDKMILDFIEKEQKLQSAAKVEMGHFKSNNETFLSTFVNLNPLKTTYMDIAVSPEFNGSSFMFEQVDDTEIQLINEVMTFLYPIIYLAKHPQQMTCIKLRNVKFNDKELCTQLQQAQNQAILNISNCVKSIHKLMLWVSDTKEELALENILSDPIVSRQTLLREVGCIDYVIKILYELHINAMLYKGFDEESIDSEFNSLIDAISSFLQLVSKNSYENSLYTVQWYFLYKHILLKGDVNDLMRLDILLTQLFQQTDMNITFQFEVSQLSKETKFAQYNKHAYNLLIAFCLYTKFRKKDGVEELINHIFIQNRESIFASYKYDGQIQILMNDKLIDLKRPDGSPNSAEFPTRSSLNDYMASCVRLATEVTKSSPAISLPHIKKIFPFKVCTNIIQDSSIPATTKCYFLELFQNSYLAKHCMALPELQFPQYIKLQLRTEEKGFLGLLTQRSSEVSLFVFQHRKLNERYKKVQDKYMSDCEDSVDIWQFVALFIADFWRQRTIYEVKAADHQFIKQILLTFTYLLKKGVFVTYLQIAQNFYDMYHRFIEFLKNSVVSANLEELHQRHQVSGSNTQTQQRPFEVKDYLFEQGYAQKRQTRSSYSKSITWLDELIDIVVLLETYQQSRMVDQFIVTKDNYLIFDDLQYLQKFTQDGRYHEIVNKLRDIRKSQMQNKSNGITQFTAQDPATTKELTKILRECSFSRKSLILEYMGELKHTDVSMVYYLIELLTFNQTRLSASVTELLWAIYSTKSVFLQTLNQTMLLDAADELDEQQGIFTEFSNIYWKIHFELVGLEQSEESKTHKHYEAINDALSDILVIFFPDYAAKSDMQLYMEINQLENDERHNLAMEEKLVKSKIRQDQQIEMMVSRPEFDMIDQSAHTPMRIKPDQEESVKSCGNEQSNQPFYWRINNSLSIDVLSVFHRQKVLRYLGFHSLMQKLVELLIEETRGTLFREKELHVNQKSNKGWEIKSEILEKSVLFLIYFVIRNEENQELILNTTEGKDSYLHEMTNVRRKQLQTLVYILYSELFRDNYNILFSMDRYSDSSSMLAKLFYKFGNNLQQLNYEACIYFLQFLQVLLQVQQNNIVQNYEMVVQLFTSTKLLNQFGRQFQAIITGIYLHRIEQHLNGMDRTHLDSPKKIGKSDNAFIDMPVEILFIQEVVQLLGRIGSTRSKLIDDFLRKILPTDKIIEMLRQLDEWYPLKLELLIYFKCAFLDNVSYFNHEEREEVKSVVNEIVQKQLVFNDAKRLTGARLCNNIVFNILGRKSLYSTSDLIMQVDYDKTAQMFMIFGVVEVCKEYIHRVVPKYFNEDVEYFDENAKNDLLFLAPSLLEHMDKVQDYLLDNPYKHANHKAQNKKGSSMKNKHLMLTQKLLSGNREEQNELSMQLPEDNEENRETIIRVYDTARSIQMGDIAHNLHRSGYTDHEQAVLVKWECIVISQRKKRIDDHLIVTERENELLQLVNLIVTLKRDDTRKFKQIISALIQILSEDSVQPSVKLKSITILRKLSNYKDDLKVSKSILKDMGDLGFTDFLCDLIKGEDNATQKLEYIKAFVEYIDDSSREIQTSFLQYLQQDATNSFIISLQHFVNEMFQDIKLSESSNVERRNAHIAKIMNYKVNACIYVFELFRLGCEDHFLQMQDFLRNQPNSKQPVNFILYTADLFEKYVGIMNEHNAPLGQKLVDFLIESVQGPCSANQSELCHNTRILEVVESIILQQRIDSTHFQARDIVFSSLRTKVLLLQLSLMEGNADQEIAKKISQYFNPQVLIERMELVYWKIIKKIRNTQIEINLEFKVISRLKTDGDEVSNNYGIIQTRDTKETLPNQKLFMEFFHDQAKVLQTREIQRAQTHKQSINSIAEEELEQMVDETFTMYILLKKLSLQLPELKDFVENDTNQKLKKALTHYKNQTASIEIVNMNGNLEKIYFPLPFLMQYLTEDTKFQFMETVNRDSINDKINGLLDNFEYFYMEMVHFMKLRKVGLRYNNRIITYLRNISFVVAFFINLLITIDHTQQGINATVYVLAVVNIILYGIILLIWITIRMQLEYDKIYKEVSDFIKLNYLKKNSHNEDQILIYPFSILVLENLIIFKKLVFSSYTVYWMALLLLCILGTGFNRLYYGFLLLDIIDHSSVLRNVIKSISQNYQQLLMTALLGVLLMYLYSLMAFQSEGFRDQLQYGNEVSGDDPIDQQVCYSAFQCLIFVIHQGLRAGGGVGDALESPPAHSDLGYYASRVVYDVSFFIIINIIWLNIIFGIIIDTFAELRDNKTQKDFDQSNRCFICNLSRTLFEKEGVSFDNHVQKYHNPWNYLAYCIHLKVKQKTEHTGIETYVQDKLQRRDISWLPIQKALDLEILGVQYAQAQE